MKNSEGKNSKFDKYLVYCAVLALVTVLWPNVPVSFVLSIIGVPVGLGLGLALALAPPLFCLLLPIRLLKVFIPQVHYAVHTILIMALFVAIPMALNISREQKLASLHAMDNAETTDLSFPRSVALIEQNSLYSPNKKSNCEELCLRLLLNESVDSFFANRLPPTEHEITPDSPLTRYWIESRSTCPTMVFPDERPLRTRFKNEEKGSYPADLMRQRIADGHCLLSEPSRISAPALTIFVHKLPVTKEDYIREVSRISAYEASENQFNERYRATQVKAERYDPILLIGKLTDNHLRGTVQLIGTHLKKTGSANLEGLLAQVPVNLSIANVERPDARKGLKAALADPTAKPNDPRFLSAETFFNLIIHQHSVKPDDAELVRALLEDPRFKTMDNLKQAAPALAWASPDGGRSLAKALSERLKKQFPDEQRFLQSTLRAMPDSAFGISNPVEK